MSQTIHTLQRLKRSVVTQEQLRILRNLEQKQAELRRLQERLAAIVRSDLESGADVEPGAYRVRLLRYHRGLKSTVKLVIE